MENSLLYHLPIDPMLLIVGFSVLSVVLLIAVIVCIVKMNKLYRRYDLFMRGKDAETLEDTLEDILEELKERYHSLEGAAAYPFPEWKASPGTGPARTL